MAGARHDKGVTSRKKPDRRRFATTIITPSSSVIVRMSMAAKASLEIEDAEADHEAGAEQSGAGAVEPLARQTAERHDQIGGGEDDDGDHARRLLPRPRAGRIGAQLRRKTGLPGPPGTAIVIAGSTP